MACCSSYQKHKPNSIRMLQLVHYTVPVLIWLLLYSTCVNHTASNITGLLQLLLSTRVQSVGTGCKSDSETEIWDAATPTVNKGPIGWYVAMQVRQRNINVGCCNSYCQRESNRSWYRLQVRQRNKNMGCCNYTSINNVSDRLTVVVKSWRAFCPTEISRSRPIVFTRCHETCKSSCFAVGAGGRGVGGEGGGVWGGGRQQQFYPILSQQSQYSTAKGNPTE